MFSALIKAPQPTGRPCGRRGTVPAMRGFDSIFRQGAASAACLFRLLAPLPVTTRSTRGSPCRPPGVASSRSSSSPGTVSPSWQRKKRLRFPRRATSGRRRHRSLPRARAACGARHRSLTGRPETYRAPRRIALTWCLLYYRAGSKAGRRPTRWSLPSIEIAAAVGATRQS